MTASQMKKWMKRCIELALKGRGYVSPNPRVGAIIIKNNRILGEGYHKSYGSAHAEINAIRDARKNGFGILSGTVVVNLEPCSHFGKTPPCTDALIKAGIREVVIANVDPNPIVSGKGIKILKKSGLRVHVGILAARGRKANEQYLKYIQTGRPFVALKVAQSKDHIIAGPHGESIDISSSEARLFSHSLRMEYDSILVGARTIMNDNPRLTVRVIKGRNPYRIIVDGRLSSQLTAFVYTDKNINKTIVYTSSPISLEHRLKIKVLCERGITIVQHKSSRGIIPIRWLLKDLGKRGIISVLVEGGAQIHSEFLHSGTVDKVFIITSPHKLKTGIRSFASHTKIPMHLITKRRLGRDYLIEGYYNHAI